MDRKVSLLLLLITVLFAVLLLRTAWVCDDAYITFRTVDNFLHGRGLTWNPDERVQAYTHPLWMFMISGVAGLTGEYFFSAIIISILISLAVVLILVFKVASSEWSGLLAAACLLLSKAFVDYSTSGLENPLTHLILIAFAWEYFRSGGGEKAVFRLSLLASLLLLTRPDAFILIFPALVQALWENRSRKTWKAAALGITPFILWEIFSVFYYGFPVPNTAYAKLATGIAGGELIRQGFFYLLNSVNLDPQTSVALGAGILLGFLGRRRKNICLAAGTALYLATIIKIGGDFMSGRFLAAPLLVAVVIIARLPLASPASTAAPLAAVLTIGLISPYAPIKFGGEYTNLTIDKNGIADERGYYFQAAGLLSAARTNRMPDHRQTREVLRAVQTDRIQVRAMVGYLGFLAGPSVTIIDLAGLGDPLLARLPAVMDPKWRIGHFLRFVPEGYVETRRGGTNVIQDQKLAAFYDRLSLITRGRLWSGRRLKAIWEMNRGGAARLIDAYFYRYPTQLRMKLPQVMSRTSELEGPGPAPPLVLSDCGIRVELGAMSRAGRWEVCLDGDDAYVAEFYQGGRRIASREIDEAFGPENQLALHIVEVPEKAVKKGYDSVVILPRRGDGHYKLGHLRPLGD